MIGRTTLWIYVKGENAWINGCVVDAQLNRIGRRIGGTCDIYEMLGAAI
ncbi:hypothetical protein FGIG_01100 [Fasciola gigantica]|uniref:Uncharacterized protein n=1 Tax=Fasciola gigantica TaxID=46835 RepID=A0A504YA88_FASGI|nr:hypothetical protein FGIG_01100 [Fasciola gigantica]